MNRLLLNTCCVLIFIVAASLRAKHYSHGSYYIIVDKSDFELKVFDDDGWLVTYPVVFGNDDLGDKMMEGDRRTPEGRFKIISKRVHEKWHRLMMFDFPTKECYNKFKYRKAHDLIPQNAKIGGGIGIHGVWPHEEFAVDNFDNWTQGCISMKNKDVEELYNMIKTGTEITITK